MFAAINQLFEALLTERLIRNYSFLCRLIMSSSDKRLHSDLVDVHCASTLKCGMHRYAVFFCVSLTWSQLINKGDTRLFDCLLLVCDQLIRNRVLCIQRKDLLTLIQFESWFHACCNQSVLKALLIERLTLTAFNVTVSLDKRFRSDLVDVHFAATLVASVVYFHKGL